MAKRNRREAQAWLLFQALDNHAAKIHATTGSMLDVAAVIVSTYLWRLHDELEARGLNGAADLAVAERKGWQLFQERTRELVSLTNRNERIH